jgi:cell division protein FtsQ
VYENEVTGCIEIMGSFLCFDKDGFITESLAERPADVPCVTGLDFDEAVVFKRLNIKKQSIFADVLQITLMLRKYKVPVYEINFSDAGEVTLYGKNIEVELGRNKNYDIKIAALGGVYEKASEIGGVLDMRNYSEDHTDIILKPYEKEEDETGVESATSVE